MCIRDSYNLTQEQLSHSIFPLGKMTKKEVRARARGLGLPAADRKGSQEICFIPGDDYRAFLRRRGVTAAPGPIVDRRGRVLGRHGGIPFYTVGQRRGLGLTAPRPLYVLEIRPGDNSVVVGEREELFSSGAEPVSYTHLDVYKRQVKLFIGFVLGALGGMWGVNY